MNAEDAHDAGIERNNESETGPDGRCAAVAKRTGRRCGQRAVGGGLFCASHRPKPDPANQDKPRSCAETVSRTPRVTLRDRIVEISRDPDLLELGADVAAIRALMQEHVEQLDAAGQCENGDAAQKYSAALETHGKRIQSLTGDLFASIDRLTKIQERERLVLSAKEVEAVISHVKEGVVAAVESWPAGGSREELVKRLADAFESVRIAGREEK
jgi:hypothetical protein